MTVVVRPLRAGELRTYLEIVARAIRGPASSHYSADAIEGWVPSLTEESLRDVEANPDHGIRLIAEVDGAPAGIGALVLERFELRACYVVPEVARREVGSAIVREIERMAHLELAASLNAEASYASLGYQARERSQVVLRNGHALACVWMEKDLTRSDSRPARSHTRPSCQQGRQRPVAPRTAGITPAPDRWRWIESA